MIGLVRDVWPTILQNLDLEDMARFTQVSNELKEKIEPIINEIYKTIYQQTYGKIENSQIEISNLKNIFRYIGREPDMLRVCQINRLPSFICTYNGVITTDPDPKYLVCATQYPKWIKENEKNGPELDKKIQETYDRSTILLKETQICSITQLKNQLMSFWHLESNAIEYMHFKHAESQKRQLRPKPMNLDLIKIEPRLQNRKIFATIGSFKANDKEYEVLAFHPLKTRDENNGNTMSYSSHTCGSTLISIIDKSDIDQKAQTIFKIILGREKVNSYWLGEATTEASCSNDEVWENKRHLIGSPLSFCENESTEPHGTDRLLDQKMTQIMVEMTMQNREIISTQIDSLNNELPLLTAAGFKEMNHDTYDELLKDLLKFRSNEGNKLFPPYKDYGARSMKFESKDFEEKIVYFSNGEPESWAEIIQREPILRAGAAVLPEYWVNKPNIVEEKK